MKNRLSFRILSLLFAFVLLVTALPLGVFANDTPSVSGAEAESSVETVASDGVSLFPTGYEPEPFFVTEVTDLRTENVKHFDNGDGTYEAVSYGTAVHRKDANGEWQDIDNTLTLREDRGVERYVSSDARISFAPAASGDGAIWSLSENGYSVSLSLFDANLRAGAGADVRNHATRAEQIAAAKKADDREAVLRVDNSTSIVYRNVLANVDLEYVLSGNDVKETILVQNVCENYDYSFKLSLSGLVPKEAEYGAILLCDVENGETVYVIPAPYMTDAKYEYSDAVSYRLTDLGKGEYEIVVSASAEWINDPERAFPVEIDPTMTTTSGILDTFVSTATQAAKGTSYGSATLLMVDEYRTTLFRSTSMPEIPENSFVLSAKLNVKCYLNYAGTDDIVLSVHRFLQSWDESSTWNDLSNNGQDPTLGITASSTTFQADNTGAWYSASITITSAAAHWYSGNRYGTNNNYGIALKPYSGDHIVFFQSREQSGSNISFSISYSVVSGVYAIRKANTDYYIRSEKVFASTISVDNLPSFSGTSASEKDHLFKIIYRSAHNDYIFRSMENNELILYPDMSGSTPTVRWGKVTVSGAPATNANLPTDYTWRMSTSQNGYDLIFHRENYAAPNYYLRSVSNGNGQFLTLTTASNVSGTEWEFPKYNGPSLRGIEWISTQSTMITGQTYTFQAIMYDDRINVNGPVSYAIYDTNWNPSTLATVNSATGVCTAGSTTGTFRLGITYPNAPWIWGYNITIEQSREGTYFIKNREREYYLQIDADDAPNYSNNGGNMEIRPFDGGNYQRWAFTYVGAGYYKITSPVSGFAITVPTGYENNTDVSLVLTPYTGIDNQKWRIASTTGEGVKIKAKSSFGNTTYDLVMDLETPQNNQSIEGLLVQQRIYVGNSSYNDEWILIRMLPTSGYELDYSPSLWTSPVQENCNCYSYAINNQLQSNGQLYYKQKPGAYAGNPVTGSTFYLPGSDFIEAVQNDFAAFAGVFSNPYYFAPVNQYDVCPPGTYKVALCFWPGVDFHWYRQDSDGLWSHKQGLTSVSREDNSGQLIIDPQTADRGLYSVFVGYFAVQPWNNLYSFTRTAPFLSDTYYVSASFVFGLSHLSFSNHR